MFMEYLFFSSLPKATVCFCANLYIFLMQYFGKKKLDLEDKYTRERENASKLAEESKQALEKKLESQKIKWEDIQEELFVILISFNDVSSF